MDGWIVLIWYSSPLVVTILCVAVYW